MLKEFIISVQAYGQAYSFIQKHKLWKWILVPGIIYAILFTLGMYSFAHTCNNFFKWLIIETGLSNWVKKEEVGMLGFVFTMTSLISWLVIIQLYFAIFKFMFLIFGSPIFTYLSEKTEAILTGKEFPFKLQILLWDIARGIYIAVRNGLWQTVYMLALVILSLFPIIGWAVPLLGFFIECYYYGFSMLDYNMERNQKTASESIYFIGRHKGLAIGNGLVFYMMHSIPVIGWIFAPAFSVVAATLSVKKISS